MTLGLWVGGVVLAANLAVVAAGCVLAWLRRPVRPRVVVPPAHPRVVEQRRGRVA